MNERDPEIPHADAHTHAHARFLYLVVSSRVEPIACLSIVLLRFNGLFQCDVTLNEGEENESISRSNLLAEEQTNYVYV